MRQPSKLLFFFKLNFSPSLWLASAIFYFTGFLGICNVDSSFWPISWFHIKSIIIFHCNIVALNASRVPSSTVLSFLWTAPLLTAADL